MANLNDSMILNFAGFTLQIQLMLASWMMDYAKVIIAAATTYVAYNVAGCLNTVLALATLCITTGALALMIGGATKLGNVIYKYIDELNDKLPKNSRDSARQYAFSNAGIDEPKIPFSKSGCSDAWCYSLIETKFDEFMRLLPAKNKADKNYGTSTMQFDWDDSRTDHVVNTEISVTVTPVRKVPLKVIKFGEVADEAGTINAYLDTQDLGWIGPLIKFGINNAGLVIGLIWATAALILALGVVLGIIAASHYTTAAALYAACTACAAFFCSCCPLVCPLAIYYSTAGAWMTGAAIAAGVASVAFFIIYDANPPGDIPCFAWDKNNKTNSYPLSVTVSRTTSPQSIDYGVYKTDWPEKTQSASGTVKDGAIFPPSQMFDISPNF
jgi:hypothetical protein